VARRTDIRSDDLASVLTMSPLAPAPLDTALPNLDAWVAWFRKAEMPVLADTADALEAMRANEDDVDANLIGEMVAHDP